MDPSRLQLGVLAAVVIGGLGIGAWLLAPGSAPAPASSSATETTDPAVAPPVAPVAPMEPAVARPSAPAEVAPAATAPAAGGPPPLQRMAPSRPDEWPAVDPEEEAAWVASEPVALHAERHAEDWAELAFSIEEAGDRTLAWEAMSLSSRLERARRPVPEEEVRALLMREIDLLLELDNSDLSEEVLGDLEPILQGAHHAIQGAPPPEPR